MDVIYMHETSADSRLGTHMRAAHPQARVETIKVNTAVSNPRHGIVDLRPRERFREKSRKAALLHREAKWRPDPNGRSTDFLPGQMAVQGCGYGCTYCYTERHFPNNFPKLYDDAVEGFLNVVRQVLDDTQKWRNFLRSQCHRDLEHLRDPRHAPYITFDIGCDSDAVLDNALTRHAGYGGHVVEAMNRAAEMGPVLTSFATKSADIGPFLEGCTHPNQCRIRMSLMPEPQRKVLELNTSPIRDRIAALNLLVSHGFEAHVNLSPIVITDDWEEQYGALLSDLDSGTTDEVKKQLAFEVIFLTHTQGENDKVSEYAPKAARMLTGGPLPLVPKPNKPNVLSYSKEDKVHLKEAVRRLIGRHTPYARIRYMF